MSRADEGLGEGRSFQKCRDGDHHRHEKDHPDAMVRDEDPRALDDGLPVQGPSHAPTRLLASHRGVLAVHVHGETVSMRRIAMNFVEHVVQQ